MGKPNVPACRFLDIVTHKEEEDGIIIIIALLLCNILFLYVIFYFFYYYLLIIIIVLTVVGFTTEDLKLIDWTPTNIDGRLSIYLLITNLFLG